MAKKPAVEKLLSMQLRENHSNEDWESWRHSNGHRVLDLKNQDLRFLSIVDPIGVMEGKQMHLLEGLNLESSNFSNSNLSEVHFTYIKSLVHSDFTNCNLKKTVFRGVNLTNTCFANADVEKADFSSAKMGQLLFEAINLDKAKFNKTSFESTDWKNIYFVKTVFSKCSFDKAIWKNIYFKECKFIDCSYENASLDSCVFDNCELRNENLSGASFHSSEFLNNTNICSADFSEADLSDSDLRFSKIASDTILKKSNVNNCKIHRFQLESLEDFGGLTKGERILMDVTDSVALLKAKFSGFWQWFHIAALLIFLFPYLWFLISRWAESSFSLTNEEQTISLGVALARYIYNGGVSWQEGFQFHLSFIFFLFLFVYNILRGIFLWKTKALELQEESTGLPVTFELLEEKFTWGWWFSLMKWLGIIYFSIGIMNCIYFLTIQVPLR